MAASVLAASPSFAAPDNAGSGSTVAAPSLAPASDGISFEHDPIESALAGRPLLISGTVRCPSTSLCDATLFYRASSSLAETESSFTVLPMDVEVSPMDGRELLVSAEVPAGHVTSDRVDYFVEVVAGMHRETYPAALDGTGSQLPQLAFWTAAVDAAPVVTHQPVLFAPADADMPVMIEVVCPTTACSAAVGFRTSPANADEASESGGAAVVWDDPSWTKVDMVPGVAQSLGDLGELLSFSAVVPADYVDTTGVDYLFRVDGGAHSSFSPGVPVQAAVNGADAEQIAFYHTHVLEPPRLVHAPVTTSRFRTPIDIVSTATCPASRDCQATLYYRTTRSGVQDSFPSLTAGAPAEQGEDEEAAEFELYEAPFLSASMTVTRDAGAADIDAITVRGEIPASVADTRGVDYFFSVSDGTTTSWWPGTSHGGGYAPTEGVRVGFHHTRVVDPPHLVHTPVGATAALEDLTVTTVLTCSTESCEVLMIYTTEPGLGPDSYQLQPLERTTTTDLGAGVRRESYATTISGDEITTRGFAYALVADDGYTGDALPGTTYWGAYAPTGGDPVGGVEAGVDGNQPFVNAAQTGSIAMLPVRVLEPPHPVVAPFAPVADSPMSVSAVSNCATDYCVATLYWRQVGRRWNQQAMAASGDVAVQYGATIPAHDMAPGGLDLRIDVDDGYVVTSTGVIPVPVEPIVIPAVKVPVADTTIHTEQACSPADNAGCTDAVFGEEPTLVVRREGTLVSNALIRYDLSDLPDGAVITRASLTVPGVSGGGVTVAALGEAWDEASTSFSGGPAPYGAPVSEDATLAPAFTQRIEGLAGSSSGASGNVESDSGVSVTVNSTSLALLDEVPATAAIFDLTQNAQTWVDTPEVNFGVALLPPPLDNATFTFDSREGASPPVLDLSYTLPAQRTYLTMSDPAAGQGVFGELAVTVDAHTGLVGLAGTVSLYLDDELIATDATQPYEFNVDTTGLEDGVYDLWARSSTPGALSTPRRPIHVINDESAYAKVVTDFVGGRLTPEAALLEGTRSLAGHPDLSARYGGGSRSGHGGTASALKLFQLIPFADADTREQVACVVTQPFESCLPAAAPSGSAELPGSSLPSGSIEGSASATATTASHNTTHFAIQWDPADIDPTDGDGDGVPDDIEELGDNAEEAWGVYNDYFDSAPSGELTIVLKRGHEDVTFDDDLFACGLAWPPAGNLLPGIDGKQINIDPACNGFRDYLPRHEVAHLFQYQYVSTYDVLSEALPLDLGRDSTLWWLEASAEWMTHKVEEAGTAVANPGHYDDNLDRFLAEPERDLTRFEVTGGRQYGAFIFAEHLEDEFGEDVIRAVFERLDQRHDVQVPIPIPICTPRIGWPPVRNCRLPRQAVHNPLAEESAIQAIGDEIDSQSSSWDEVLTGFAEKNYRLCLVATNPGGSRPCDGSYTDAAVTRWAEELQLSADSRVHGDDRVDAPRPARGHYAVPTLTPAAGNQWMELPSLATGGIAYTDFTWNTAIERSAIRFEVQLADGEKPDDVRAQVVAWSDHPDACRATLDIPLDAEGHGSVDVLMVSTCTFATVMVTDVDPEDQKRIPELPLQDVYSTATPPHSVRGTYLHAGTVHSALDGDLTLGVLPIATLGTSAATVRYQPTGTEGVHHGLIPWEGWGLADLHTGDSASALFRYALGAMHVDSYDVDNEDGETATSVVTLMRNDLGSQTSFGAEVPFARVTHRFTPTAHPSVYRVAVQAENLTDDDMLPRYRRVVDWNVPPTVFDEAITSSYGSYDSSSDRVRINATGVFHPNPLLRPPAAAAGPTTNLIPRNGGAIVDVATAVDAPIPPGGVFEFEFFYGAATSESAALDAIGTVGGNAYVLAKPSNESGLNSGTPLTFFLALGGV